MGLRSGRRGRTPCLSTDGKMILLTRLNKRLVTVNADQIKTVEETPDTLITLMNGDQVLVQEPMSEVVRKTIDYYRELRAFDMPAGRAAVGHAP